MKNRTWGQRLGPQSVGLEPVILVWKNTFNFQIQFLTTNCGCVSEFFFLLFSFLLFCFLLLSLFFVSLFFLFMFCPFFLCVSQFVLFFGLFAFFRFVRFLFRVFFLFPSSLSWPVGVSNLGWTSDILPRDWESQSKIETWSMQLAQRGTNRKFKSKLRARVKEETGCP